jgi:hypothetical protein
MTSASGEQLHVPEPRRTRHAQALVHRAAGAALAAGLSGSAVMLYLSEL